MRGIAVSNNLMSRPSETRGMQQMEKSTGTRTLRNLLLASAVAAGGNGGESAVEEYNGSSWTSATSLGTGRTQLGSSGSSETDCFRGLPFGSSLIGSKCRAATGCIGRFILCPQP